MIGNNSCGTHSLLAGQDRRQHRGAERPALRRHRDDGGRRRPTRSSTRSSRAADAAARSTRAASAFATGTRTAIRAGFPRFPRRVSGYNLDQLLPENGLQRRAGAGRHRRHVRGRARGEGHADREPAASIAGRPRLRRRVCGGRSRPGDLRVQADRPRRVRGRDDRRPQAQGRAEPRADARQAAAICSWSSAPTIAAEAQATGRSAHRALQRVPGAPATRLYTPQRSEGGLEDPRVGTARRRQRPRPAAALGGVGRCRGGAGEARAPTCATPRRCWTSTATTARIYGHFGHGCIHMQIRLRSADASRHRASTAEFIDAPPTWSCSYGGSISGEHGDGQSRGALLPKMFGPELMSARSASSRRSGIRDEQDEPGQARRRVSADGEPPPRRRLHAARAGDAFHVPRRQRIVRQGDAALHRRRRVPQARRRDDVPELHGDARGKAQHARPRAHAVRDAPGRRRSRAAGTTSTSSESLDLCLSCKACKTRVPDQRRHRDLSRRVPVALLREPARGRCTRTRSA